MESALNGSLSDIIFPGEKFHKITRPIVESFPKRNFLEPFKIKIANGLIQSNTEPVSCKLGEFRHQKGRKFWLETKEKFVNFGFGFIV
jgi:hypothetical protein